MALTWAAEKGLEKLDDYVQLSHNNLLLFVFVCVCVWNTIHSSLPLSGILSAPDTSQRRTPADPENVQNP